VSTIESIKAKNSLTLALRLMILLFISASSFFKLITKYLIKKTGIKNHRILKNFDWRPPLSTKITGFSIKTAEMPQNTPLPPREVF
jgi:hypothetical protein